MEISQTDLRNVVRYLDDTIVLYKSMSEPKHQWRAVMIKRLTEKLKRKLHNDKYTCT